MCHEIRSCWLLAHSMTRVGPVLRRWRFIARPLSTWARARLIHPIATGGRMLCNYTQSPQWIYRPVPAPAGVKSDGPPKTGGVAATALGTCIRSSSTKWATPKSCVVPWTPNAAERWDAHP